jgi:predicted solute-binding protein
MSRKDQLICIAALAVVLFVLWYIFRPVPVIHTGPLLQQQNDSLLKEIQGANDLIKDNTRRTDSLIEVLRSTDWKIIKTKEYYETIIHDMDTATANELQRFFTERYHKAE